MSFQISSEPIMGPLLSPGSSSGAVSVFEGRVKTPYEGLEVIALEYEAHPELATPMGEAICKAAIDRFGLTGAVCFHRVGRLAPGEVAIRVEASAVGRRAAMEAVEWIVDEVKATVPIWKNEVTKVGEEATSKWLLPTPRAGFEELMAWGAVGDGALARLRDSKVVVVGLDHFGTRVAQDLVASGVGHLTLVDEKRIAPEDVGGQSLFEFEDIGSLRSQRAEAHLRLLNPYSSIEAAPFGSDGQYFDSADFVAFGASDDDSALDLNDRCVLGAIPFVFAKSSLEDGQLVVAMPGFPCLRCLWPSQDQLRIEDANSGSGALQSLLGSWAAAEIVAVLTEQPSPLSSGFIGLLNWPNRSFTLSQTGCNKDCPVCRRSGEKKPTIN